MSALRVTCVLAAAVMGVAAGRAEAITLVSGGPGMQVLNPVNQIYTPDPYNINEVFYWTERAGVTLGSDLVVSMLPPGSFPTDATSHSTDSSLKIAAGTTVDSFMLNYDPQGGTTVAAFSFDSPILGLITSDGNGTAIDQFLASDFLINPAVPLGNIPAAHYDARGIEPASGDFVRWLGPSEIEIHLGASVPGDQIRVITGTAAPEPGMAGVLVMGAAGLMGRRRRAGRA